MNGAGNDFILIDNRDRSIQLTPEQITRLCDRRRGIGADGLLLCELNPDGKADWRWQFYNRDGGSAEMCGNGARCFAAFIRDLTGEIGTMTFETGAGVIEANFDGDRIKVALTPPQNLLLNQSIELNGRCLKMHSLNTGVPHAVILVENVDAAKVFEEGRAIREHPHFSPDGTNVNFVQIISKNQIRVRTYERGVEDETLACGTGVSAAGMIASKICDFAPPISVQVQGGEHLIVDFKLTDSGFEKVSLTGAAEKVFIGEVEI